jgi:hypothetical protein
MVAAKVALDAVLPLKEQRGKMYELVAPDRPLVVAWGFDGLPEGVPL